MSKPKVAWGGVAVAVTLALGLSACKPEYQLEHYLDRDVKDDVFYFVMPDRFHNANPDNDQGYIGGGREEHGFDPTHKAWYHGGDIQGLSAKLDYLEQMGVTAIWMTPILKNKAVQGESSAYHGYWTLDFTQIDPHLGSNEDLKALIDDAHDRNIKVFFDIITNHTADVIKYEECHEPDGTHKEGLSSCEYKSLEQVANGDTYTPFVPAGEEYSKIPEWLNDPKYYHNQGDSTFSGENSVYGDFVGLDDINTDDPEVVAGMIDIFKNIVSEFKPDGFRIDTVKHVNIEFWQDFAPAIEAHAVEEGIPQFFMFGEVYDANPKNLSRFTTEGKLPSVLDFGFQGAMRSVVADQQSPVALRDLFIADDYYNDADSDASRLMNFIGNHDMGRFGFFLQGEDTPENLQKTKLAHSMMYFLRGVPVIYYGDEQGFTGDGNDQDARENMDPSLVDTYNDNQLIGTTATTADANYDQKHPIYRHLAKLAGIYRMHPTLRNGIQIERYAEESGAGLYVINRVDPLTGETYLVAMNNASEAQSMSLETQFKKYDVVYGGKRAGKVRGGELQLKVDALDFVILRARGSAEVSPTSGVSLSGLNDGDIASGEVQISALLDSLDSTTLPLYEVSFAYRAKGGELTPIARDVTPPYQLYWDVSKFEDGTQLEIEVTTSNGDGVFDQQWVNTLVDSRVPTELSIDYQNGNDRSVVFAINQSGRMQGPITLNEGQFNLEWQQSDQTQLLVFGDYEEPFYDLDKPLMITRNQVVSLSQENESGELTAALFLNHEGELADQDNASSVHAHVLDLYAGGDLPLGTDVNLRGGLNGWGADPMTYLGQGHYKVAIDVSAGDIEFKFADSNWSPLNIGGPVSETGLLMSSNPSNLVSNLAVGGLTEFVLVTVDEDADGVQDYILPLITPDYGPLEEPFYLRGDHNGWAADTRLSYWADGQYRHQVVFEMGNTNFKVANQDWSRQMSAVADVIELDTPVLLSTAESGNDQFNAPAAAYYDFSFTPIDGELELVVGQGATLGEDLPTYDDSVFVRGELNGWGATDELVYVGQDQYQVDLVLGPDSDGNGDGVIEFKIADANWASINFGGQAVVLDESQVLVDNGGNITIATPASNQVYRLSFNANAPGAPQLTVSELEALIVHYQRTLGDYEGWGLHVWGDGVHPESIPTWAQPLPLNGADAYGRYGVIVLNDPTQQVGLILHKGDEKNSADDLFHVPSTDGEIWILEGDATIYADPKP